MADQQSELVRNRYERGTAVAAVAIAGGWHIAHDLAFMVASWSTYDWPYLAAAAWVGYAAGVVTGARAVLAGRAPRWPWWWCGATLLVTATVAVAAPGVLSPANWAWGAAGWLAILLLWRRRLSGLLAFLAGNAAVSLGVLLLEGTADRVSLARYLVVVGGTVTLQLGFAGGARALRAAAGWAAEAAAARADTATAGRAAEQAHQARLERYGDVQVSTSTLLADLAAGADPADPAVRHACAVQAARLRRLLVERDDTPDPLVRELRACSDIAERKGVMVELSTAGTVPPLPAAVRRALAEPAIATLAGARSRARITVIATPDEIAVSVLADTDPIPPAGGDPGITVEWHHTSGQLWMEARTANPQASTGWRAGQPGPVGRTDQPDHPIHLC